MILKDKYSSGRPPSLLSRVESRDSGAYIRQDIQYTYYVGDGVLAVEIPRYI